jgi:hypothetical protein
MSKLLSSLNRKFYHKEQGMYSWHGYDISKSINLSFNESENH